jgi:hypothetical protein
MSLRKIADEFSLKVVSGQFAEAQKMLGGEAREVWTQEGIQEAYSDMVEYFNGAEVKVEEGWNDEFAETKLDEGTLLYVPIISAEGDSEAISVVIDESGAIVDLEFGRP